jgi:3D-(3,5/4)-trihydroxycyclohexane-1,2-dione acylhydrolase (decyclizing)
MLDPAECGPAFLGMPQDVQGWAYDYPASLFAPRSTASAGRRPIRRRWPRPLLKGAARPMIIAGGGVQYSGAVAELTAFAEAHAIPVVETIAGRANMLATHPLNTGPIGVTGSDSANAIAEKADVMLAVGTRLQDFTTGSWTAFAKDAKFIGLNVARHDAAKHLSRPWWATRSSGWRRWARRLRATSAPPTGRRQLSRAHGMGRLCRRQRGPREPAEFLRTGHRRGERACATRATGSWPRPGGLPAEVTANWRTLDIGTVDVEFGFSCMGYEIAGGWGARIAQSEHEPDRDTIVSPATAHISC